YPRINPRQSRGLLARWVQRSPHIWSCCRWGLPCRLCHHNRGALLPHHFTLTSRPGDCNPRALRRYLSVALSVGLLRLAVSEHRALCSSDFPHPSTSEGRDRRWDRYLMDYTKL